jgi:hypothetical protein
LETSEQEWLVWEINKKIAEVKGVAPTMDDMPPEDRPEVRRAAHAVCAQTCALAYSGF